MTPQDGSMDRIRQNIRSRLSEMNISARELSRRAGLNVGYVNDFLEGRSTAPEVASLGKLATALGISVSDLLYSEKIVQKKEYEVSYTTVQSAVGIINNMAQSGWVIHTFTSHEHGVVILFERDFDGNGQSN